VGCRGAATWVEREVLGSLANEVRVPGRHAADQPSVVCLRAGSLHCRAMTVEGI
jgi:hypothetical protein